MPRYKTNYREGSCFVLPLRSGGFARGIVARMDGKGRVFGYFFGPKLTSIDAATMAKDLKPRNAIFVHKFGDLGLVENEWKVIGELTDWDRENWPMPPLIRVDEIANKAWLSYYDEDTFECLREDEVDPILRTQYPHDGLSGAGAVEIHLTKLLAK